jgi:cell division septation protein DedD
MEEKYPIKFSLSQFILLLGVEVIVLALVFLLGARFGGIIFPVPQQESQIAHSVKPKASQENKLVDSLEPPPGEVKEEGEGENPSAEQEEAQGQKPAEASQEDKLQVNKNLFDNSIDKNTMVRFKSSGNTKFAIEVGTYFDDVLASQMITKLKQKGYEAYLVIEEGHDSKPNYSVRVGSFGERKLAEDLAIKMSNQQGMELRVVQVD